MPQKITLEEWDARYGVLLANGLREPRYGGPLSRHVSSEGDLRLRHLRFDNSAAALRLWNFVLTENERLRQARANGDRLVGAMKDLGTVPVIARSVQGIRTFYPDGAWWTPCLMECSDRLLDQADALGLDASFCPVRAMVPAFQNAEHFPLPDLLVCSTGAVCDDFSAIAQRLEHLGHRLVWWEIPRRREPAPREDSVELTNGCAVPRVQVDCVRSELERIAAELASLAGREPDAAAHAKSIREANQVRHLLKQLRSIAYTSPGAPLPALEMLLAEMLALHFCSDFEETIVVLEALLTEAAVRTQAGHFAVGADAIRIFWVNPVADFRALNLLEELGGRLCGSDYMFSHALDPLDESLPPLEALARAALADPMVGSTQDRARRICSECATSRAEAIVISRIPGASHCAWEGVVIHDMVRRELDLPCIELEIPPLCDPLLPGLGARIQALVETARFRRS